MRSEFAEVSKLVLLEPLRRTRAGLRMWRRTRTIANRLEQFAALLVLLRRRPDVVWCNTVLSSCYVRPAFWTGTATVLHAHEFEGRIEQVLGRYDLGARLARSELVGCAPKVTEALARISGRSLGETTCIPSVPDGATVRRLAAEGTALKREGKLMVGACGSANMTKGVDLWLAVAARAVELAPDLDVAFVWIGEKTNDMPDGDAVDSISFTGTLTNPFPVMASLDLFLLTSRVDCFPLVVLEAMTLGVPVVAFDVGDVAYQLGDGRHLHPIGAVDEMASDVVALLRDPLSCSELDRAGRLRVERLFGFESFATGVVDVANRALGQSSDSRLRFRRARHRQRPNPSASAPAWSATTRASSK